METPAAFLREIPADDLINVPSFNLDSSDFTLLTSKIYSMPLNTSAGLDKFYPRFFREMLSGSTPLGKDKYLKELTLFLNIIFDGLLPVDLAAYYTIVALSPLKKPNTNVPRPIAVPLAIRRLSSKLANKYALDEVRELFKGTQVGVGAKQGAEAILFEYFFRSICRCGCFPPSGAR